MARTGHGQLKEENQRVDREGAWEELKTNRTLRGCMSKAGTDSFNSDLSMTFPGFVSECWRQRSMNDCIGEKVWRRYGEVFLAATDWSEVTVLN